MDKNRKELWSELDLELRSELHTKLTEELDRKLHSELWLGFGSKLSFDPYSDLEREIKSMIDGQH